MLGASSLWGLSSAILSDTDTSPLWLLALYGLVIGAPILVWGLRVPRPWRVRWIAVLFVLDLVNIGGFFTSLQLAPVGPAVALHLASPVILVLYELVWLRRPATPWRLASLALIVSGCTLAAVSTGTSGGGPLALLGLALALTSAVCVALTNVLAVHLAAVEGNWQIVVGAASLARAAVCGAAALVLGATFSSEGGLVLLAAVVAAVAVPMLWAGAAPRISARSISILALNEAVVATVVAVAVLDQGLTLAALLATVVILVAIALEVLEPSPPGLVTAASGASTGP